MTWPKRAKGLVKNGRARFISENRICLACPPDDNLEDKKMSDREFITMPLDGNPGGFVGQAQEAEKTSETNREQVVDVAYVLKQMEAIRKETSYLHETIEKLSMMSDGDSPEAGSPGNILGRAKATAFADIVRCRETTNQEMLKIYEKIYDDMVARTSGKSFISQNIQSMIECVVNSDAIESDDKRMMISDILQALA